MREELSEETTVEGPEAVPKVEVPDWDLSITSLLQVGGATSLYVIPTYLSISRPTPGDNGCEGG